MKGKGLRRIVVVGSTNTDMVVAGKRLPSPGETVSGGRFLMNPGGKGANQAVAVARLSAQRGACAFIAKVGDDVFGRETAARLKKDSILPRLAVDPREPSGTALILVDAKGQNMISVALGSNGTLSPKDVARHRREIECASALLLQLETPIETVVWAAKAAHDAGVTVILNPAPARKLPRALYPLVDWITPNETEAGMLSGVEVVDAASAAKAVSVLKKRGAGHVLVTMGDKGVYCGDDGRLYPCRKVKAVDCVAAGDTFNGAFAVALADGRSTAEAIAFAQAAAAISVTRRGAQTSIPSRREVLRKCSSNIRMALGKCLRSILAAVMIAPLALRADRPVLAVNEDNDHYFKMDSSMMDEAHLVSYLDEILSPGAVTDFFMCPCGQRASFDSRTWEPIWAGMCEPNARGETNDVWCVNAKLLHDRGIDPYEVWIAKCRESGVRAWLSMRMNDVHFVNIPGYFRNTTFWRMRRDLRRRPDLDPEKDAAPWDSFAFNYAHREVQDYHFAMFKELVDRYDADGYELDWMRFTRHLTPGRERDEASVLTEFMRRCRAYANEAAARRGRKILISARVPAKYDEAIEKGFCPETWAREGLVDWLITSNFYETNDFEIDVAGWKRRIAAANPSVRVFPGASDNLRKSDVPGRPPIPMSCADFSRWADAMYSRGADGLYVFNVPYLPDDVRRFVYSGFRDFEMLPSRFDGKTPVVVETKAFRLVINPDATAKSLVLKTTGEECIAQEVSLPVFAAVQKRPFNNETRLVNMVKRTMYPANRIRRNGDVLRIGFDTAPYEAEVRVTEKDGYAAFALSRLISNTEQERQYYKWNMDVPPVEEFRLLQLPVARRRNFGDWLNVEWDDTAAIAVVGATPYMDVDHESRGRWRLMRADSLAGIGHGLTNGVAVLAAAAGKAAFLSQIAAMEEDFDLPRGVESRRNPLINASLYWTSDISPANVDEHVANMKRGGFRMALIYHAAMFRHGPGYNHLGDYEWRRERYPNGFEDLKAVLSKIRAAGIAPGFHTLQTFIGFKSRYVVPEADPRLNIKRFFALERPLSASGATCDVYVAQNPVDSPMHPMCRILKFGTELMTYTGYSTVPPYKFTGVGRGHLGTTVKAHGAGYYGGILDVSECAATSCCIDQKTSLQDEVGDKIAKVFDCGMEFLYFDGSEDVDVPCNINISLSQWKVARHCGKMPLFTEGCAKTHFGWHLQSGANAFDVFPPEVFKEKIVEYPYPAALRLAKDFTRVDFGWWRLYPTGGKTVDGKKTIGTQPDMWEYGTSKAAAFDCPSTMQMGLENVHANGRADDLFETVRRWEDVRAKNWLTAEQKEMLKDPKREFHLYLNERGEYELLEWKQLDVAGGRWTDVRAFMFERGGKRMVAYWHVHNRARLVFAATLDGTTSLDCEGMKYFETELPADEVRRAFASAEIVDWNGETPQLRW